MNKIRDSNIDKVELVDESNSMFTDDKHRVVDAVRCDRYEVY